MPGLTVTKPSCSGCEFYKGYYGSLPLKTHGVMLRMGDQYCTGSPQYRIVNGEADYNSKSGGCPKLKLPPELRVYRFKDKSARDRRSSQMQQMDPNLDVPSAYSYALYYQGSSPMTAWILAYALDEGLDIPDLEAPISIYDVVEIDDGIVPYFFYRTNFGFKVVLFDRDVARKNKLECEHTKEGA